MFFILLFAVSGIEPSATAVAVAVSDSKTPANKMVCKREAELGSLIGKRVCRTKQEWDELAEQARRDMRQQSRNAGDPNQN